MAPAPIVLSVARRVSDERVKSVIREVPWKWSGSEAQRGTHGEAATEKVVNRGIVLGAEPVERAPGRSQRGVAVEQVGRRQPQIGILVAQAESMRKAQVDVERGGDAIVDDRDALLEGGVMEAGSDVARLQCPRRRASAIGQRARCLEVGIGEIRLRVLSCARLACIIRCYAGGVGLRTR